MIAMKFGGSSVANAQRIRHISDIVKARLNRKPVLVVSAMGDTTDHLLEAADRALAGTVGIEEVVNLHRQTVDALGLGEDFWQAEVAPLLLKLENLLTGVSLVRELSLRTRDYLVSFGERLSVRVLAAWFRKEGVRAEALDAWQAGFISNGSNGSAEVLDSSYATIASILNAKLVEGILPIVTGFIAKDEKGIITTLGRGGSDLTATIIGAACGAEEIQVWKDVDGILTADPRIVKNARPVSTLTYEEASELAYFGAQVLHPRSMQPCIRYEVPVRVKNSYNPDAPGTIIVAKLEGSSSPVRAITAKKKITLLDIVSSRMLGQYGFLARVFDAFEMHKVSVDMVATSEVSVSLTLDEGQELAGVKKDLEKISRVNVKKGKAIITLIGDVARSSQILAGAFAVCAEQGVIVQMVSQGASKVNMSFIVDDGQTASLIPALHTVFFKETDI